MLVNSVSYFLIIVLSLVEVHSHDYNIQIVGEVCKPTCKSNCTNSYCYPEECACKAGCIEHNDICVPVCVPDCIHGTCVAPNMCQCDSGYNFMDDTCVKEQIATSSNEDTTTKTRDPLKIMMSTYNYHYNHTENTTLPWTTTLVPYFVSSSISTETVDGNDSNTTVTSGDPMENYWMQQHGMYWIPIIIILTTGLIVLLVWQKTPMKIVNFFKGRKYNVQGAFLLRNGSSSFERLEFISDEWGAQS